MRSKDRPLLSSLLSFLLLLKESSSFFFTPCNCNNACSSQNYECPPRPICPPSPQCPSSSFPFPSYNNYYQPWQYPLNSYSTAYSTGYQSTPSNYWFNFPSSPSYPTSLAQKLPSMNMLPILRPGASYPSSPPVSYPAPSSYSYPNPVPAYPSASIPSFPSPPTYSNPFPNQPSGYISNKIYNPIPEQVAVPASTLSYATNYYENNDEEIYEAGDDSIPPSVTVQPVLPDDPYGSPPVDSSTDIPDITTELPEDSSTPSTPSTPSTSTSAPSTAPSSSSPEVYTRYITRRPTTPYTSSPSYENDNNDSDVTETEDAVIVSSTQGPKNDIISAFPPQAAPHPGYTDTISPNSAAAPFYPASFTDVDGLTNHIYPIPPPPRDDGTDFEGEFDTRAEELKTLKLRQIPSPPPVPRTSTTCNSEKLGEVMIKVMGEDVSISKRRVAKAAAAAFEWERFDVFCAKGEFSYSIHARKYCEVTREDVTCFAFR